jgi:hypothetical protein
LDPSGKAAVTVNFKGGTVSAFPIEPDGRLGESFYTDLHAGPPLDQPDVKAVVVEAPYDTYRNNIAHHAWLLYKLPRWVPVIPIAIAFAGWRAGFDPDEVDAVAAARRLRAPLLAIVDGADDRMPEPVVRRVLDAHPGPKRLWVAPGAEHVGASLNPGYWPVVLGFLAENGV